MTHTGVRTRIWREEPEPRDPFTARRALCHGYDVYGEMVGRATWADMVFLLFRGQAPTPSERRLLDALAVALANPGPRSPSVHAAMCGGVAGSNAASSLMAALAVGAGQSGGAREVYEALRIWQAVGTDLAGWRSRLLTPPPRKDDVWPEPEHAPGFEPHGVATSLIVLQCLGVLSAVSPGPHAAFLRQHREALETATGLPLGLVGVAAAALHDLGFSPDQGEVLFLLLRLPGAAAHALEQWGHGFKEFPFPAVDLQDDPAGRGLR